MARTARRVRVVTDRRPAPLTAEQRALAGDPRYLRLASDIAWPYAERFPALADEFRSESLMALCSAARTFDPSRRVSFYTHAAHRINGSMLDVCRHSEPSGYRRRRRSTAAPPRIQSLDRPLRVGGQLAYDGIPALKTLADAIEAGEDPVGWEAECRDELIAISRHLPVRHRSVIRALYGHAEVKTMKALARAVGCSESWISQVHAEAIDLLRGG